MLFNFGELREDTKQTITGIIWFLIMVPLAMAAHYAAKYYQVMEYTIMGWLLATIGGIQLGWALKNRRLYNVPVEIKKPEIVNPQN